MKNSALVDVGFQTPRDSGIFPVRVESKPIRKESKAEYMVLTGDAHEYDRECRCTNCTGHERYLKVLMRKDF